MIRKISNYFISTVVCVAIILIFPLRSLEQSIETQLSILFAVDKSDTIISIPLKVDRMRLLCGFEGCSPIKVYYTTVVNPEEDKLVLYSTQNYKVNEIIELEGLILAKSNYKGIITKKLHKEISATTPTKLIEAMRITVLKSYWFDIILYLAFMFFVTFIGVFLSARSKKKR